MYVYIRLNRFAGEQKLTQRCKAIVLQSEQINKYLLKLKTMQQVMEAPIRAEGALNRVESKLLTIQREKLRTRNWHMTWGPKVL